MQTNIANISLRNKQIMKMYGRIKGLKYQGFCKFYEGKFKSF